MKRSIITHYGCLLLTGWILAGSAAGQDIHWRVSVKFILDANGSRPSSGVLNTTEEVEAYIEYGNWVLDRSGRGYRLKLLEVLDVENKSDWSAIDASNDGDGDGVDDAWELRAAALDSFTFGDNAFLYNDSAINIYIVHGSTAGSCACGITTTPAPEDLIVLSQNLNPDWVVFHECGHFLGLSHTHSGQSGATCADAVPGDDGIADTLPDHSPTSDNCWDTADQIAINNYGGRTFAMLTASEQLLVNHTLSNIMSYHGSSAAPRDVFTGEILGPADRSVMTADQLDRMTDWSNGSRAYVASGKTYFVDVANTIALFPLGNSHPDDLGGAWIGGPFITIAAAVAAAGENDIVLVRPGTYTDTTTFDKAMVFRATRGNALIKHE